MNASQASRIALLLAASVQPLTCPITGQPVPAADVDGTPPRATIRGYDRMEDLDIGVQPDCLTFRLNVPGAPGEFELHADDTGRLLVRSTVQIPAADCDCECDDIGWGGAERCPRHGTGVRYLDCYRIVTAIGWEIVGDGHDARWRYVIREGDPTRDVLAEYRAERAAVTGGADAPASDPASEDVVYVEVAYPEIARWRITSHAPDGWVGATEVTSGQVLSFAPGHLRPLVQA